MKKIFAITLLILSISSFAQDTIPKRFSLGIGPTWGTLGWGGNLNLAYSVSKKFNIRLRGVLGSGRESKYGYTYDGVIQKSVAHDMSASANYYLLGRTKSKYGLYVGVGFGYFKRIYNDVDLYDRHYFLSNGMGSHVEKHIAQGLAPNLCLGANFKLGPGKLYIEGYFSAIVIGNYIDTYVEYNAGYPPLNTTVNPFNTKTYKQKMSGGFLYEGIVCFNFGYAIPF